MRRVFFVSALLMAAGVAQADPDLYAGIGITKANVNNFLGSGLDIHNTNWKAIVGFKPPVFPVGAEAEYLDFGSETTRFGHAESNAFAAYAVGYLPLPLPIVSVYGKAGLSRWELKGNTVRPALFSLSDHGTQLTWGLGAQAHFGRIAARLEYERFNISGTDGADIYTLGATYSLL